MKIIVSGTIAYDVILDYPGRFADHIDLKKIHALSLSFLVDRMEETAGGTAANIVYNLALLGVPSETVGSVGRDGDALLANLKKQKSGVRWVNRSKKYLSSRAVVFTDRTDNQVAAFYRGAMSQRVMLPKLEPCDPFDFTHGRPEPRRMGDWPIIAPEDPANMTRLARHYQSTKHRYIFDPGQQVIALSKAQILTCLRGASIVVGNDYEIDNLSRKIGKKKLSAVIFRTFGPKGSEIIYPNGKRRKVGVARPKRTADPTGAGDAYRAGLLKGIISGLDLMRSAQLGATAAAFAVEKQGTQNHRFDYDILVKRHNRNFKEKIS